MDFDRSEVRRPRTENIDPPAKRGRDVRTNYRLALLAVLALASLDLCVNAQTSKLSAEMPDGDLRASFVGSTVTCSQPYDQPSHIRVPQPLVEKVKLKARLVALLRDSLYDDANGVVNIAREKEIKKLANKLRSSTD
jgi:hypothetical protein